MSDVMTRPPLTPNLTTDLGILVSFECFLTHDHEHTIVPVLEAQCLDFPYASAALIDLSVGSIHQDLLEVLLGSPSQCVTSVVRVWAQQTLFAGRMTP